MQQSILSYDKAFFLRENIKEDILKYFEKNVFLNPIEYLYNCKNSFYRNGEVEYPKYEKQRVKIFRAINLDGESYGTAINLLDILEYPDYLLEAFKQGKIDLLDLPNSVTTSLQSGKISEYHALSICKLINKKELQKRFETLYNTPQNDVAEIRLYAERRAGEILKETELNKGGNPNLSSDTTGLPKLKDIGITRDQSSDWQHIANIPEEDFIQHIRENKRNITSYIR